MKFTSSNDDHSVDKVEPQLAADTVEQAASSESSNSEQAKTTADNAHASYANESKEKSEAHNPVLEFVKNLGETAQYLWDNYFNWLIHVSWGKMFLTCLLVLIGGSVLCLHSLANWFVFGSLLLKCFVGKEDQTNKKNESNHIHTEGS